MAVFRPPYRTQLSHRRRWVGTKGANVRNAPAEATLGSGTAYNASVKVSPTGLVGAATGTGAAFNASASLKPNAGVASGTGAANNAAKSIAVTPVNTLSTLVDDFTRTLSSDWGNSWTTETVSGGTYGVDGAKGYLNNASADLGTWYRTLTAGSIELRGKFQATTTTPVFSLYFRTSANANIATASIDGTVPELQLVVGAHTEHFAISALTTNTWYWLATQYVGGTSYAKSWKDGDPEPTSWQVSWATSGAAARGAVTLYSSTTGNVYIDRYEENGFGQVAPSGTGTANQPTITATSSSQNAQAQNAAGTGTAYGASLSLKPNSGTGAGTGASGGPASSVAPNAQATTGTGTAFNAAGAVAKSVSPTAATGTGAAYLPGNTVATNVTAATGTGAAAGPAGSIKVNAGVATGTGSVLQTGGTVWIAPANHSGMGTQPALEFLMPPSPGNMYFQIEIDTVNTFNSGNLQTFDSSVSQVGWEYFNGSSWVTIASTGVPNTYSGKDARYTVQTPLTATTWYRRVRTGT